MRSVIDRLDREDVQLHQPHYLTLPLSVYEGMWTTLNGLSHMGESLCIPSLESTPLETVGKRSNFKKIPTHMQDHGDA